MTRKEFEQKSHLLTKEYRKEKYHEFLTKELNVMEDHIKTVRGILSMDQAALANICVDDVVNPLSDACNNVVADSEEYIYAAKECCQMPAKK